MKLSDIMALIGAVTLFLSTAIGQWLFGFDDPSLYINGAMTGIYSLLCAIYLAVRE